MAQEPIHITLEDEDAIEFVRGKVRSGEYASEDEVVLDLISEHHAEQIELDRWIKEVGVARYDAYTADPSSAVPLSVVERELEEQRRLRTAKAS